MDKFSDILTTIKDNGTSSATRIGDFLSSSANSGVTSFKTTSLGESFFKNIGAIMIVVFILLGGILYIDLASEAKSQTVSEPSASSASPTSNLVEKKLYIEPNTGFDRIIPTEDAWTAPIISMKNELKEAFGTPYTENELDKIQTTCSDSFCVMHNKSPAELERACNSITTKQMCGTKCCCGWTKYVGFEGDNDPTVIMNTAQSNISEPSGRSDEARVPGKCVAGNSMRPYDMKDANNQEKDIAYYYYLGQCVGGRGCMKQGAVRS